MNVDPTWMIPPRTYHAHFDCFSGAAGDMMLAACLDAGGPTLLPYIAHCIEEGLAELKGEFTLSSKRVWKSKKGSIAATYLTVRSKYGHRPASVPQPGIQQGKVPDHRQRSMSTQELVEKANHASHSYAHCHDHGHSHHHEVACDGPGHIHGHDHHEDGPLRNLPQIRKLLQDAPTEYIPQWVKLNAIAAFTELAEAEALTHGTASSENVHFHEVGAVDSIVDTVGTCLALHCLGVGTVSCSRLPLGEGTVWTDHGLLPVPAPATLRLMVGMPTCPGPPGVTGELVTPTAAALLKVLTRTMNPSKVPGRCPCFTVRKVGIGAGTKDFENHPNVLRVLIGDDVMR